MPKLDRFRVITAERLRSTMTDEARILWHHLWRIPLEGTHFRKQSSIGRYYVDFASHRLKLVIELDGAQYAEDRQFKYDARRDRWLQAQGYRVAAFLEP